MNDDMGGGHTEKYTLARCCSEPLQSGQRRHARDAAATALRRQWAPLQDAATRASEACPDNNHTTKLTSTHRHRVSADSSTEDTLSSLAGLTFTGLLDALGTTLLAALELVRDLGGLAGGVALT